MYDWASQLKIIAGMNNKTNITYDDTNGLSLGASAVVIYARSDQKYTPSIVPSEEARYFIPNEVNAKYQVILKKSAPVNAELPSADEELQRVVNFWSLVDGYGNGYIRNTETSYKLKEIILVGIEQQVGDEIQRWLDSDTLPVGTDGKDFVKQNYPSLVATDGTIMQKADRISTAQAIFRTAFATNGTVAVKNVSAYGFIYTAPDSENDAVTLLNSLNNKFQLLYLFMSQATNWSFGNSRAITGRIAKNPSKEPYWEWSGSTPSDQGKKNTNLLKKNKQFWGPYVDTLGTSTGSVSGEKRKSTNIPGDKRGKRSKGE